MPPLLGSATFTWTDGTGQTHNLRVPLQKVRPAFRGRRWVRESLDMTVREVWTTGYVYEVVAEIRYEDAPQSLIDLLLAGWRGIAVTYNDGDGNSYACHLIEPSGDAVDAGWDDHQVALDEHRVEIRLRKTDGTAFNSAIF